MNADKLDPEQQPAQTPAERVQSMRPVGGGQFAAFAGSTTLANTTALVLGVAASIIAARALGPTGKGTLMFLRTVPNMVFAMGNLGIGSAIAYRIARGLTPAPRMAGLALVSGVAFGLAGILVALVFMGPPNKLWGQVSPWVVWVALAMLPLIFLENFLGRTLIAQLNVHHVSGALIVGAVVTCSSLAVVLLLLKADVPGAVLAYTGPKVLVVVLLLIMVWRQVGFSLHFDRTMLVATLGYGIIAHLLLFSNQMVYKVDIFFVKAWQGDAQLGLYSVSAQLAQLFWLMPNALSKVLRPVASRDSEERSRHALGLCRMQSAVNIVGGPILVAVAPLLIRLYGIRFQPAVWPFYALLPGVLMLPIYKYLVTDLTARGKQRFALLVSLSGLSVDVVLVALLVPRGAWYGGIVGAGIASTVAYSLMALAMASYYVRRRGVRYRDIFVPTRSDWLAVSSLAKTVLDRIRRRPSAQP